MILLSFAAPELSPLSQRALCRVCDRQATQGTHTLRLAVVCVSQHEKIKQMDQLLKQLEPQSAVSEQQPAGSQNAFEAPAPLLAYWNPAGCCSGTGDSRSSWFSRWSTCFTFSCWLMHTTFFIGAASGFRVSPGDHTRCKAPAVMLG